MAACKSRCSLAVLLLVAGAAAFPQAGLYDRNADSVRALRYAAWEAGTLFTTAASPYLRGELESAAERAAAAPYPISDQARDALREYGQGRPMAALRLGDGMALGAAVEANIVWYPSLGPSGAPGFLAWDERAPLLELPLSLRAGDALVLEGSLVLREDHNSLRPGLTPANSSSWIESADYVDIGFPFRAFAAFEDGPYSASLGRAKLRWGPGASGTLFVSDEPDYYDFLQWGVSSPRLGYKFLLVSLDDGLSPEPADYPDGYAGGFQGAASWTKSLVVHRWDLTFFGRLSIGIVEGLALGGVPLSLAYLNPLLILHNRYAWNSDIAPGTPPASSALGLELRANPWRYMELYGSFIMNQLQTSYEIKTYGASEIPDSYGWIVGAEGAYPLGRGWAIGGVEYVYTNPWLYIRESRFNSFFWGRAVTSNVSGSYQRVYSSLGYPAGPDSEALFARFGWDAPGMLLVEFSVESLRRGSNELLSTAYEEGEAAAGLRTPSGTVRRSTSFAGRVEWAASPAMTASAGVRISSVADVELALGLRLRYPSVKPRAEF